MEKKRGEGERGFCIYGAIEMLDFGGHRMKEWRQYPVGTLMGDWAWCSLPDHESFKIDRDVDFGFSPSLLPCLLV